MAIAHEAIIAHASAQIQEALESCVAPHVEEILSPPGAKGGEKVLYQHKDTPVLPKGTIIELDLNVRNRPLFGKDVRLLVRELAEAGDVHDETVLHFSYFRDTLHYRGFHVAHGEGKDKLTFLSQVNATLSALAEQAEGGSAHA